MHRSNLILPAIVLLSASLGACSDTPSRSSSGVVYEPCDGVSSAAWRECNAAVIALQSCCYEESLPSPFPRTMTAPELCRSVQVRGLDPVTECGRLAGVAGNCGTVRRLATRGEVTGVSFCCCDLAQTCSFNQYEASCGQ